MTEPSAWLLRTDGINRVWNHKPIALNLRTDEHLEPLYTRESIEAEIVAWLRDEHNGKLVSRMFIATAIESGEYRSKSDE